MTKYKRYDIYVVHTYNDPEPLYKVSLTKNGHWRVLDTDFKGRGWNSLCWKLSELVVGWRLSHWDIVWEVSHK